MSCFCRKSLRRCTANLSLQAVFFSALVLANGSLSLCAAPPPGYYDTAQGKAGAELRAALHLIIDGHTIVPYSSGSQLDTADVLKILDRDPGNNNNVILVYSGLSVPASTFGTSSGWNREHLWPNSYGIDSDEPSYSDLFNLRPCDATVNSARGNKYFDRSNTNDPNYRLPAHAEAPLCSTDSDSWEPPAQMKGDIARSLFYMDVRYEGDQAGEPNLRLTDDVVKISSSTNLMGRLSALITWHAADPVDNAERERNDFIFEQFQLNRNPFVDNPEWVLLVFAPNLKVSHAGANVKLSWGPEFPNARLEATPALPSSWVALTNAPAMIDGSWTILQPITSTNTFYRLKISP